MTEAPEMTEGGARRSAPTAALALALFAGTLALYAGAPRGGFVNYDDDRYVYANEVVQRGLTSEGATWAFTTWHASNWHPLTWMSHMLDVELYGLEPGGHHVTSMVLHAATALLLFLALSAMTRRPWPAFFAVALFAWHPLRVESVAWIAERKDVLSGCFAAAMLLAWAAYVRRPGHGRYLLVILLFALGLMAKPMLVTLPFVLLLLDVWPLARIDLGPRRLLLEKLPLILLAAASAVVTLAAQRAGGATELLGEVPAGLPVVNALASISTYVRQTVWPVGLTCFYPHASITSTDPLRALLLPASLGAAGVVASLLLGLRRRRTDGSWLVGVLWFLGALVPVLGLIQVGTQAHADRYTYLPSMGLAIALAFGASALARRKPVLRTPLLALALVALLGFGFATVRQVGKWRGPLPLWRHALAVTEGNYIAHNNLGRLLADRGELAKAGHHFERSLSIQPGTPPDAAAALVATNLAGTQALRGLVEEALETLLLAAELDPEAVQARVQLGTILSQRGADRAALSHLRRAVELAPQDLQALNGLAWILATSRQADLRDGERAVRLAQRANRRTGHRQPMLLETLAAAHAERGDWDEARRWQSAALERASATTRPAMLVRMARYEARLPARKSP